MNRYYTDDDLKAMTQSQLIAIILRARVALDPQDPVIDPPPPIQTALQKIYIKDLKLKLTGRKGKGWLEAAILKMGRCCLHIQLAKSCQLVDTAATTCEFIFRDCNVRGSPRFILTSSPTDVVLKTLSMLADPFLAVAAVDVIAMAGEWVVSSHPQLRAIVDAVAEHRVRETISRLHDLRFDSRDLQRLGKFVKHIGMELQTMCVCV
jgi:hypothetical protein